MSKPIIELCNINTTNSIKNFPKGRYIIGDLCYLFNDKTWDIICQKVFEVIRNQKTIESQSFKNDIDESLFTINGIKCWLHRSHNGDGLFDFALNHFDNLLNEEHTKGFGLHAIACDSGHLGLIPLAFITNNPLLCKKEIKSIKKALQTQTFLILDIKEDFIPYYTQNYWDFGDGCILEFDIDEE